MEIQNEQKTIERYGVIFKAQPALKMRETFNEWLENNKFVFANFTWFLEQKKLFNDHWNTFFPFIVSADCGELFLNQNKNQRTIMCISHPNFLKLKYLHLGGNQIQSLQQLQFMNMPVLELLYLKNNNITKVSALNKCGWNSLKYLNFSLNKVQRIDLLRLKVLEISTQKPKQRYRRYVQNESLIIIQPIHEDVNILAKLVFQSISCTSMREKILSSKKLPNLFLTKCIHFTE